MLQGEQKKSVLQFIVKNIVFRYWHEARSRDKFFFQNIPNVLSDWANGLSK